MKLAAGLYEALITRDHARALRELEALVAEKEALGEEGRRRCSRGTFTIWWSRRWRACPRMEGGQQVELANRLVELLAAESPRAGIDGGDGVAAPAELLLAQRERGAEPPPRAPPRTTRSVASALLSRVCRAPAVIAGALHRAGASRVPRRTPWSV